MATERPAVPRVAVDLVAVDDAVLDRLVRAATEDADADEVTPPLTAGGAWTPARVAWLRDYHRDRRAGLAGPAGEATWAVLAGGSVVGSVRLRRTGDAGVLETGAWLTRGARGQGLGHAAMAAVVREAAAAGATRLRADTTRDNAGALGLLRRLGFRLSPDGDAVGATLVLDRRPGTAG